MRLHSRKSLPQYLSEAFTYPWIKRLFLYSVVLMFVGLGDAIMSYYAPVYINSLVKNEMYMGLIIATSSIVGLVCDITFGELLSGKHHSYFLTRAIVLGVLFAISFIFLPKLIIAFIFSMAIWGVYYELALFSDFHFINRALDHPHHNMGWSVLKMFTGIAYLIGPVIASFLFASNHLFPPIGAIFMFLIAFILFFIFRRTLFHRTPADVHEPIVKKHIGHEFKLWHLLIPKLWPVLLFIFVLTIMDAAFWTIGTILSERLGAVNPLGGLLIVAYMLPSLFAGYLGAGVSHRFGKKRTAFITGAISGLIFVLAGLSGEVVGLLVLVFIASIFAGIALPEIFGAIEDYIERLGHSSNALVGLENSTTSLAFIIGPVIAGALASLVGDQKTFAIIGGLLVFVSILALVIVPRKIHLPQQSLVNLES